MKWLLPTNENRNPRIVKKKFLLAILVTGFFYTVQAQTRLGVEMGLNFSKVAAPNAGSSFGSGSKAAFHIGLMGNFTVKKYLDLRTGLIYVSRKTNYFFGNTSVNLSPNFLELPLQAVFKANMVTSNFLLLLGPYIAVGLGGQYNRRVQRQITFGNTSLDDLKPLDYGMKVGAGFEVKNIRLIFDYDLGMANMNPSSNPKLYNSTFNLNLVLLFGGNQWKNE